MTLFRTAVQTAISEVHKLLRTGGVPTAVKKLFFFFFWRWSTASRSLRVRARGRATHNPPRPTHPPLPPPPNLSPVPNKPYRFCGRKATCLLTYYRLPHHTPFYFLLLILLASYSSCFCLLLFLLFLLMYVLCLFLCFPSNLSSSMCNHAGSLIRLTNEEQIQVSA